VPRALVTGATGLVGSHIVDQLFAHGWNVRALVRRPSSELTARGVELSVGDVLDGAAFVRAATACDVIFHTAAAVTPRGGWESFRRPNVDGTSNAIDAAERAGARLLHLSSVAVYSRRYEHPSERIHEDVSREPLPERAYYARSKRESEDMVLDAHARGRIWATAVRPCIIYGTRDRQFVPRVARGLRFGVGLVIGGGHTTLPLVGAANVAQGALLAAAHEGAGGRAYNLANDFDVTLRDLYRFAGEGLARRIRIVSIPLVVARIGFRAWRKLSRLAGAGMSSVVTSRSLDMVTMDNPFTSARARLELGWTPRVPPDEGLVDAFRWWRAHAHDDMTKGAT
jgi:nucleoside-diphosphate-sugar epimerase